MNKRQRKKNYKKAVKAMCAIVRGYAIINNGGNK
jgi:hypothetical protein